MQDKSLWQQLSDGVASAVTDIRQKAVEEPFFGRAVTDDSAESPALWPAETTSPAFGSATHERELPSPDLDLDR